MSYIRDAMQKAEILRKSATLPTAQETPSPSPKEPLRANKTILSILILQFLLIFIQGGIFYLYIKQDYRESIDPIRDKLDQLGGKLDPLKDQINRVEDSVKSINKLVTEGTFSAKGINIPLSPLPKEIPDSVKIVNPPVKQAEPPAIEIKTLPPSPLKKMRQDSEQYHKVEQGETLYRISKRYGISVEEIRRVNKLQEGQAIQTGQKILVSPAKNQ
jgi:LysM repeat protein